MPINGQDTCDELQTKYNGLMREIDKLQTEAFTRDNQLRQMKDIIEEKRHTQQLAGWAIDRALEIIKIDVTRAATQANVTAFDDAVIHIAERLCAWVHASSARETKTQDVETIQ